MIQGCKEGEIFFTYFIIHKKAGPKSSTEEADHVHDQIRLSAEERDSIRSLVISETQVANVLATQMQSTLHVHCFPTPTHTFPIFGLFKS